MVGDDASLRVERGPGTIVLVGEIDAHNEALVGDALTTPTEFGDLRVDVSGVTFIDSSGLRVLLGVHQQLIREGRRLVLVTPAPAVTRLIRVAGLISHFHVEPQLESADAPQCVAGADR